MMKLFMSLTSPFAPKVRIVIRERGLVDRVEEVAVVPVEARADLVAINPLSQIPALIDETQTPWTDSGLISAWLAGQGQGPALLPPHDTPDYWRVRRLETAASGLFEMMAKLVYEGRRPETERSPFWLQRWQDSLLRGFEHADAVCPEADAFDIASLSLSIAGTFCSFRLGHLDWRSLAPRIARLNAVHETRPSFIETYPRAT